MAKDKRKSAERKEALMRIIVLIASGIILALFGYLVILLAVINWFITLISGKRNKDIAEFCEYWNTEKYKFTRYLTSVSNTKPFPFTAMERISKFI